MIIDAVNLGIFFNGVSTAFNKALALAPSRYREIAMLVPSSGRDEVYGWLRAMPRIREWIGDRVVNELAGGTYAIPNRTFENTISIKREDLEDDRFGVYAPMFEYLAQDTATFPDSLVFALLTMGFFQPCYDGLPFFSQAHLVQGPYAQPGRTVSNVLYADGSTVPAGVPWYLLDCSKPVKPLVYQERRAFNLVQRRNLEDPVVFDTNKFVFGVDGRCNVGFGFWQLAAASNAPLTPDNYATLRANMTSQVDEQGRPLNITPTHLVCHPILEKQARTLLLGEIVNATTNPWKDSAEPLVTQWVAGAVVPTPAGAINTVSAPS